MGAALGPAARAVLLLVREVEHRAARPGGRRRAPHQVLVDLRQRQRTRVVELLRDGWVLYEGVFVWFRRDIVDEIFCGGRGLRLT